MSWILIIYVTGFMNNRPAITSISMNSERACQEAGNKFVEQVKKGTNVVTFICAENKR